MTFGITRNFSRVPVLMFHSIGLHGLPWTWSDMSESLAVFEGVLSGLAADGYSTVGLDDLYAYMAGTATLPDRPVVLTFDDGYLDNWLYAVPLLRFHGMRATVYVTPEFVPEGDTIRPTARVDNGHVDAFDSHNAAGFMNWSELRAADSEGVLDVQSHALTHTWYFTGPSVADIHRPAAVDPYPWLAWNAAPSRKPFYLTENQQNAVPWGTPVFEHEKALITRQFRPERSLMDDICAWVAEAGGPGFFDEPDWKEELNRRFPPLADGDFPGDYETQDEYAARVESELTASRSRIEDELGKSVRYLAWPGGGVNDDAAEIARKVGFRSWTLSSWQQPEKRNIPGSDPEGIKRVTGRSKVHFRNRWIANGGAWWVLQRLYGHQGSLFARMKTALAKLRWLTLGGDGKR